jgi:hypothetical protein
LLETFLKILSIVARRFGIVELDEDLRTVKGEDAEGNAADIVGFSFYRIPFSSRLMQLEHH